MLPSSLAERMGDISGHTHTPFTMLFSSQPPYCFAFSKIRLLNLFLQTRCSEG